MLAIIKYPNMQVDVQGCVLEVNLNALYNDCSNLGQNILDNI